MPATACCIASPTDVVSRWLALGDHLCRWYHHPDLQALAIALSAALAHYAAGDPVWLFIIGPAASGKTSIIITALSALPRTWIVGDLTPKTLLSGMNQSQDVSLLKRVGSDGVLLFKDFTTILSKRKEDQQEVAAQLREVFDGEWHRSTGTKTMEWSGKITVIAAATPAVESAWSIHRELGERFMQVRWPNGHGTAVSRLARLQHGHEKEISSRLKELTEQLFLAEPKMDLSVPGPDLDNAGAEMIDCLAASVACLRATVQRDGHKRDIINVNVREEPARIGKALASIARSHARLFHHDYLTPSDLSAALRVGLDSVPSVRSRILQALPPMDEIGTHDISKLTGLLRQTIHWHTEEMEALNLIEIIRYDGENAYKLHRDFRELWLTASNHTPA